MPVQMVAVMQEWGPHANDYGKKTTHKHDKVTEHKSHRKNTHAQYHMPTRRSKHPSDKHTHTYTHETNTCIRTDTSQIKLRERTISLIA